MSVPVRPPPASAAPLVPLGARTRCPPTGDGDRARVARLWEAIARTRAELAEREVREGEIVRLFDTQIRPRERAFTDVVLRLTARLVAHHEGTPLDTDARALLGLWIDENLQDLATHPFASREATDTLARRWRAHLDDALDPIDASLARLHERRERDAAREDPDPAAERAGAARADGETPDSHGPGGHEGARRDDERGSGASGGSGEGHGDERTGERDAGRPGGGARARSVASRDAFADEAAGRVVSRLFRRLARALHPDLEPDESRRHDKDRLMSECLRARDELDIDTLLSLHEAHVGPLPDDVAGQDLAALVRLLHRQLGVLRGRLRRALEGDALRRMIVARYGGGARSERLVAAHAAALDAETLRVDDLETEVSDADGLFRALRGRREIELDRLAIDELTGCLEPG